MKLMLIREPNARATPGQLFIDGKWECFTLEDVERPGQPKVYGQTAIPRGVYRVDLTMSARFKVVLPIVLAVPGFDGIRIHAGNTTADTDGCVLVGQRRDGDRIAGGTSRPALAALQAKLAAALAAGDTIELTVS